MATVKPKEKTPKPPVRYSQALADIICERLSNGESLNSICSVPSMPNETMVRRWAMDDYMGFSLNYARARELGYSRLADELIKIADTPVIATKTTSKATGMEITEGDAIERSRLMVDTRKWMLSKMLPKIYGDKQTVDLNATVDVVSVLAAARNRVKSS